jgi:hypothetical protein
MECVGVDGCPPPSNPCEQAACVNNQCTKQPAPVKTPCPDIGGVFCDGAGNCVQCLVHPDCMDPASTPCTAGIYTAPPTCDSGKCTPGVTTDCGAMHLVCKSGGCAPCTGATECGSPVNTTGCVTPTCNGGQCGADTHAQGSTCTQPTSMALGACNATGSCVPGKYVFVTSATFGANFGGVLQMDAKCQEVAANAGLAGTWMSWTSDGQNSPGLRFNHSPQPYLKLDDTMVAMDWNDLTSGSLRSGIDIDQNHNLLTGVPVWTGTTPGGQPSGTSCGGWMLNGTSAVGTVGVSGHTDSSWSQVLDKSCGNMEHLYCFQQ